MTLCHILLVAEGLGMNILFFWRRPPHNSQTFSYFVILAVFVGCLNLWHIKPLATLKIFISYPKRVIFNETS